MGIVRAKIVYDSASFTNEGHIYLDTEEVPMDVKTLCDLLGVINEFYDSSIYNHIQYYSEKRKAVISDVLSSGIAEYRRQAKKHIEQNDIQVEEDEIPTE